MKRIRHSPEQIVRKIRVADAELASGKTIAEVCKGLGVAETSRLPGRFRPSCENP